MSNARRPIVVLFTVLLAAPAAAQLEHEVSVPWNTALGSPGLLGRSTSIDATGDGRLDLFVRGGAGNAEIVFFDGVWSGSGSLNTGIACRDFDAAPNAGPDEIGALAFVNSSGLNLLKRNPLASPTFAFESPTSVAAGPWIDAKIVRTGDVDGVGSLDYVGVKADGRTLILRANGGPSDLEVDVGRDILDVVLVNWAPGAAREIAVLSLQGVEIRSGSLSPIDALVVAGHNSVAIASLAVPSEAVDRLAWIGKKVATGRTHFALLRQALPRVHNLLELDAQDATAFGISTGDVDGDLDTDVVITRTSTGAPWYLASAPYAQTPWFSGKVEISVPSPTMSVGQAVLARFANDDTTELVLPAYSGSNAKLELFISPMVSRLVSADVFQFVPDIFEDDPEVLLLVDPNPQFREVRFQLNFLNESLAPPAVGEDRRFEVTVWKVAQGSNNVAPNAETRYWIDWPAVTPYQGFILHGVRLPLPAPDSVHCDLVPRFIEVRQVRTTPAGVVIESGPTYTFGVSRGNADYGQYWPSGQSHEFADLRLISGVPNSNFFCPDPADSPVHASAIVIRRKPNPVAGQGVLLPAPVPGATAIAVQQ